MNLICQSRPTDTVCFLYVKPSDFDIIFSVGIFKSFHKERKRPIMTQNNNTVCFIGGDDRQKYAAMALSEYINVNTIGSVFEDIKKSNVKHFDSVQKATYEASAIILPLPAACSETVVAFTELASYIVKSDKKPCIIGGKFSPYLKGIIEMYGIKYIDYYENECFTLRNAYLTAEGAVNLAMTATNNALRSLKCAVVGYGRIGKALSEMLRGFRSDITVFARKEEALTLADEQGFNIEKISERGEALSKLRNQFDVIFNTVPERIFSNELLLSLPQKTVLIELASTPGGFDPDIAKQCELCFVDGGGIPGKYAPRSAGLILSDTILQYLKQEELL